MTRKATNPVFRRSILSRSDGRRRSPAVARRTLPDTNAPSITSAIPLPLANPKIAEVIINIHVYVYYEKGACVRVHVRACVRSCCVRACTRAQANPQANYRIRCFP